MHTREITERLPSKITKTKTTVMTLRSKKNTHLCISESSQKLLKMYCIYHTSAVVTHH